MHKKLPDWIVLHLEPSPKPPTFKCNRCGATRSVHLPASTGDFIKQGEAFADSHKECRKP